MTVRPVQLYGSWRFYQDANAKTARGLFFASIVHLPLLLSLLLLHKKVRALGHRSMVFLHGRLRGDRIHQRSAPKPSSDLSIPQMRKPKELKDETDRDFLLDATVVEPPPAHAPAAA